MTEDRDAWGLVERILATPAFVRSPRLAEFLSFICRETLEGHGQALNEQHIGSMVFGRRANYDSSADTVVRSNALRLRRQLEQYFQREGQNEALRLEIPRGGYIPVFRRVSTIEAPPMTTLGGKEDRPGSNTALDASPPDATPPVESPRIATRPGIDPQPPPTVPPLEKRPSTMERRLLFFTLAVCFVLAVCLAAVLRPRPQKAPLNRLLWSQMFTTGQPTRIVLGDSGLVLFHAATHQYVSLDDYLRKDYTSQMLHVEHVDRQFANLLVERRYTSVVDAGTVARLLRLPEATPDRTLVQYSRDMHLNDFKSSNLILLGAQEADPWVELFEQNMDFVFTAETPGGYTTFLDRHPRPGERTSYGFGPPAPRARTYAVVAFLPNLDATGHVLILEGLNMTGTEAAVDLMLDGDRLGRLLSPIRRRDGSLPYFEMLLESTAITENASPARVVAIHVHSNYFPGSTKE